MMDLDDELVAEYDVVINDQQPLYWLQYPLRPRYRPYGDQGTLLSATLSEQSIDMEFSLNTNSTNFDTSNCEYKRDCQKLTGKPIVSLKKYFVGYPSNGALTLTPLEKIMQIRPDTGYLDTVIDKRQIEDKDEIAQLNQEKESKKLRVFKKKEVKEAPKEAKNTKLMCCNMGSIESLAAFKTLTLLQSENLKQIPQCEYVKSILPTPMKVTGFRDNLRLLAFPLAVEELLIKASVVSTEEVLEIFPNEKNAESVLIQKAVVIENRWVRKSEVLRESLERDVCIYMLWKNGQVERSQ